jgi:tetratricopeptide (TPR) repeat protein
MSPDDDAEKRLLTRLAAASFNATSKVWRFREPLLPADVDDSACDLIDNARFAEAAALVSASYGWEKTFRGRLLVGNAAYGCGDMLEAAHQYQEARTIAVQQAAQREAAILNNRAMMASKQGDYPGALELIDKAIALFPQWSLVWVTKLSVLQLTGGDYVSTFLEMTRLFPNWAEDRHFAERLRNDPELAGVRRALASFLDLQLHE